MAQHLTTTQLAGVEYSGRAGTTANCLQAITRLICSGGVFNKANLITCQQLHAFLLFDQFGDVFVVKNGFASGYVGEGSRGLATALKLLERHNIDTEEHEVNNKFMERIEHSCLLQRDIEWINNANPIRPSRLYDYIHPFESNSRLADANLSQYYPDAVPYRLIDPRIMDLAVQLHENGDRAIFSAYRRLEDTIRSRTQLSDSGAKLFSKAFLLEDAPLTWNVPDANEAKGRANMFTAVFGAFRNARMHREQNQNADDLLREFLLINELFLLEACAIPRASATKLDS